MHTHTHTCSAAFAEGNYYHFTEFVGFKREAHPSACAVGRAFTCGT